MTMPNKQIKVIISGGGTAGHIYPALAVADKLRADGALVLFVGALGKMEMERVPAAGYEIIGLPVAGLQRRLTLRNLAVPFKLVHSLIMARRIVKKFQPDVVVGFGGYASAPVLRAAAQMGIPTVLQEQNSYAGLTNRLLAKKAAAICTAYQGMERFFPEDKIFLTGNPLRLKPEVSQDQSAAYDFFALSSERKTLLVTGGSLGTRTLNEAMMAFLEARGHDAEVARKVQIIWQTGRYYNAEMVARVEALGALDLRVEVVPFIERMDYAYAVADLVVCRAGASTVSEIELLGKPALFVPSPNVAEDHQTKNAAALVVDDAAEMVPDVEAVATLLPRALELLANDYRLQTMGRNVLRRAKPHAARHIARLVTMIAEGERPTVKNTSDGELVYFIGIGGIGMSALARFFKHEGYAVAGYDRTESPLTLALEDEGIPVHYDDDPQNIPTPFHDPATVVIYTPAVPDDSPELNWFREHEMSILKRSQALGKLSETKYLQAVAGTHGKTTTSTLAAYLNHVAAPSNDDRGGAFLGGISKNFGTNMLLGTGDKLVAEADEFDRSFLRLHPAAAVITAADPDHLDIYGTPENFREGFEQFIRQIRPSGRVVLRQGVELTVDNSSVQVYSYSLDDPKTDYHARHLTLCDGGYYTFDVVTPARVIEGCRLGIPGLINVENAVGAIALVDSKPLDYSKIPEALTSFTGVARRFDFHVNTPAHVYMDDYAHHPRELTAMLTSVRKMFPNRQITIAFQPHLYSRTSDFYTEFATALSLADRVLLIPIYPAREEPMEGVNSEMIAKLVTAPCELLAKDELVARVAELRPDVMITAGAGDIDRLIPEIAQTVRNF